MATSTINNSNYIGIPLNLNAPFRATIYTYGSLNIKNNEGNTVSLDGKATRAVLFVSGITNATNGAYMLYSNVAGTAANVIPILAAADVSVTVNNGVFTITNNSTNANVSATIIAFQGTFSVV